MSDDKFKDLTRMNARHLIKIRIEEEVRTKFPDVGGAFADIHHTRKISGNPEDTKLTANVSIADTLNVAVHMIASAILDSDMDEDLKKRLGIRVAHEVAARIMRGTEGCGACDECKLDHTDDDDDCWDDTGMVELTPEQEASMMLLLTNPMTKYSIN